MKQFALWAAAVLLPACCMSTRTSEVATNPQRTLVKQLEDETVALVQVKDDDGNEVPPDSDKPGNLRAYCTGVWVSADTFLTAEHCVDDIGRPSADDALQQLLQKIEESTGQPVWTPIDQPVTFSLHGDVTPDRKVYHHGKVSAVDMYNDLVLVKTDTPVDHKTAHLAKGVIHDGDDVHMVGHTVGMWWCYIRGYVSAHRLDYIDDKDHKRNMLQMEAPIFFGDSGGGAFDAEGNLIGIADTIKGYRGGIVPNVAFYVHRDVIKVFLEHNKILPLDRH